MKKIEKGLIVVLMCLPFSTLHAVEYVDSYTEYTYATANGLSMFAWQGGSVKQDALPLFDVTYGYGIEYMSITATDSFNFGVPLSAGLLFDVPALPVKAFGRFNYDIINATTGYDLGASISVGEAAVTVKMMNRTVVDFFSSIPTTYNAIGIAYTLMW